MRWFVEVSPTGDGSDSSRYCIEAKQWQAALQETRKLRGDSGPLSKFAIELLDTGYRAVDPASKTRYTVAKAPEDAELTQLNGSSAVLSQSSPPSSVAPPTQVESKPAPTASSPPAASAPPASSPPAASTPPQKLVLPDFDGTKTDQSQLASSRPTQPSVPSASVPDFKVVRKREEDPSARTPITYREYAYSVKPDTSIEQAEALIWARFREVKDVVASRAPGKFIQLAVFDHVFEGRPGRKPLVTLAWKDWRGEPVLQYPSGMEPALSSAPESRAPESVAPYSGPGIDAAPVSSSDPTVIEALRSEAASGEAVSAMDPSFDIDIDMNSGPVSADLISAPDTPPPSAKPKRGRKSKPKAAHTTQPDTPSQKLRLGEAQGRRGAGEELISELFETMHDLHFQQDVMNGCDFTLNILAKTVPCEAAIVHVFDINTRHLVVVRARGPNPEAILMQRTPDSDPVFRDLLRAPRTSRFDSATDLQGARWSGLGVEPAAALVGPVRQGGRYLGLIELCNPAGGGAFYDTEVNALDYICEQLAEFLSQRPLVLDSDVVLAKRK